MGQYVVVGLGIFGSTVCRSLSGLGHEVLALDVDEGAVDDVREAVAHAAIVDATEKEALERLISDDFAAAIVSLGDRMEASVLATMHLQKLGVKRVIAKANSEDHGRVLSAVGATEVIFPEREVAESLAQRLHEPNLIDHIPLAPEYSIVEMAVPDAFVGRSLKDLALRQRYGLVAIAVKNALLDTFDLVPDPDSKIKPDSVLVVIGKEADLKKATFLEKG